MDKDECKQPPVDREKLLDALRCCSTDIPRCSICPYPIDGCAEKLPHDALEYIRYLEEQLEEAGKA